MKIKSGAELEALLAAVAAPGGSLDLLDRDTLLQLLGYAQARAYVVYGMEVFELRDGLEFARVDLTLVGGDLIQETEALPYQQRLAHIDEAVRFTISAADEASAPCGFIIWLEEAEAWRDGATC